MSRCSFSNQILSEGRRTLLLCTILAFMAPRLAGAQAPPDAGSVLEQIEKQHQQPLPPKSTPQFEAPAPMQSLGGVTVTVKEFRFAGNTLLSTARLSEVVRRFRDHPIDFAELQNAAIAVATAYRGAGWVVRAYLPQQDVTGGIVTIQIIEAKFDGARIGGQGRRMSNARLRGFIEDAQRVGQPVNADALDRGLLLINDLPGVSATGRLAEGRNQGETSLVVDVTDGALLTGDLSVDNEGARFTGSARVIADASLNDRFGLGDRLAATLLHSKGSDYQRLAYDMAAGEGGWRAGVNGSHLSYDIVTAQFAALDAHGTSTTVGFDVSYPLIRASLRNLYFTLNGDDKRFDNDSAGQTTTHYSVLRASAGLSANLFDNFHGGGANTASLTIIEGNVDLGGSPNEAADALTTRTGGGFRKLTLAASRLQVIAERLSVYAGISAQLASQNLDSSEKLYLGGAEGVRAYPEDEGGGSQGVLMNLEARTRVAANFNIIGFFDWGTVRINKDNDFAGAPAHNSESLKGVGISVAWSAPFGLTLKAIAARRIGSNPNPTSSGDDQDGSLIKNRLWLQASMAF